MRKRSQSFLIRLNEAEHNHLMEQVNKSGLTREKFVRFLLVGLVPKQKPTADYYSMMKELNYIGHNLNQIAMQANFKGDIDKEKYAADADLLRKALLKIQVAVELPENEKFIV